MKKIMYITALWLISCLNIWAVPVVVNLFEYGAIGVTTNPYNGPAATIAPPALGFEYELTIYLGYRLTPGAPCLTDQTVFFTLNGGDSITVDGHTLMPGGGTTCIQQTIGIPCTVSPQDFYWSGVRFFISYPPVPPPTQPVPPESYMAAMMGSGGVGIQCASNYVTAGHLTAFTATPLGYEIKSTEAMPPIPPWFGNENGPQMTFIDLGITQIYNFY